MTRIHGIVSAAASEVSLNEPCERELAGGRGSAFRADHAGCVGVDRQRSLAVVCDLRLDNRERLLTRLDLGKEASDAALILEGYARWGRELGRELRGEFAVAVWCMARRELALFRDVFGVRPLYYARIGEHVAFGSRVGDLVRYRDLDRAPDTRAIVDYLCELPEDESRTALRNVKRVPPGCAVTWSARGFRSSSFIQWAELAAQAPDVRSDADAIQRFRELFFEAVRRRASTGRVAVLLSGGLDSSSVASALAGQRDAADIVLLSGAFPSASGCDESEYQRAVADAIGAVHRRVDIEASADQHDLASGLARYAQPVGFGGQWLVGPCLAEARRQEVSVVLTGVDGDRVVSHGEGWLEELARAGRFPELWREARATRAPPVAVFARKLVRGRAPQRLVSAIDARRARSLAERRPGLTLLQPELRRSQHVVERLMEAWQRPFTAQQAHLQALTRSDRTADVEVFPPLEGEWGLEVRHPFFDRDLAEFCLQLPGHLKRRHGQDRYVLREALRGVLPEAVRTRSTKAAFEQGFARWARRAIEHEQAKNVIDINNIEPYLQPSPVRAGLRGESGAVSVDLLWRCVVVSAWLRGLGETTELE